MDSLPENLLLRFNSDTLQSVRKQYDLDNPDKLKDSSDSLFEWIQTQDHFVKKDYSKCYLERLIIRSEGSIEMAKKKLDLISTFKTLLPKYFEPFDMDNSFMLKIVDCCFLPKMTENNSRVLLIKNRGQRYDPGVFDFFKYSMMVHEYNSAHDYTNGYIAIIDYTENNVKELLKAVNFVELRQAKTIVLEGYNLKLNAIHLLTSSKIIDVLVVLLKNVISPSIGKLIKVHRNVETLHKYVSKDILPIDYGGKEKPLKELSDKMLEFLKSEEYINYFNEMKRACTNEALRRKDIYNDLYMGIPGSFNTFCID